MVVHSVPTALPLLLTLSDSLSLNFDSSNKSDVRFLTSCIQPLVKVLCRSDWSLVIRERINHTLSNVLWTLSGFVPDHAAHSSPLPSDLLPSLVQELESLYEAECEGFVGGAATVTNGDKAKPKTPHFPPGGSIGSGKSGRFTTYFQSLLELVLALKQYSGGVSHAHREATPTNGSLGKANGKKVKNSKKLYWLEYVQRAVDLLFSLRKKKEINRDFYRCFYKSLPSRTHSSLLVLTGISPTLQGEVATETIKKICSGYGGMADLYLPLREMTREEREEEERKKQEERQEQAKPVEKPTSQATPPAPPTSSDEAVSDTAERPQPLEKKNSLQGERPKLLTTPTSSEPPKLVSTGVAVIQIGCGIKSSSLCTALLSSNVLQGDKKKLSVSCVSEGFKCGDDETASKILSTFLRKKLYEGSSLKGPASSTFSSIFNSLGPEVYQKALNGEDASDSRLRLFLQGSAPNHALKEALGSLWEGKDKEAPLTEAEFMRWLSKRDSSSVWCGLLAAGYDFNFNRLVMEIHVHNC